MDNVFSCTPAAGKKISAADEKRSETGKGTAIPESIDTECQSEPQKERQSDAYDNAVEQRDCQVELEIPASVDK